MQGGTIFILDFYKNLLLIKQRWETILLLMKLY